MRRPRHSRAGAALRSRSPHSAACIVDNMYTHRQAYDVAAGLLAALSALGGSHPPPPIASGGWRRPHPLAAGANAARRAVPLVERRPRARSTSDDACHPSVVAVHVAEDTTWHRQFNPTLNMFRGTPNSACESAGGKRKKNRAGRGNEVKKEKESQVEIISHAVRRARAPSMDAP